MTAAVFLSFGLLLIFFGGLAVITQAYQPSLALKTSNFRRLSPLVSTRRYFSLNMSSPAAIVDDAIKANKIIVFSKSYCPYCNRAKAAITEQGQQFKAIELDQVPNGSAIQDALATKTGQRTVPNIFINGKHVGGCDKTLEAIASGEFQRLVA
eukprot:gene2866-3130_t